MDGKIAVSFSGGKDSAVVLYLMAEAWSISKHKDEPLQVFFSNTTNEFTSMLPYIREYIKYIEAKFEIKIKFEIVRGEYTYFQVIDMVGLPFVSKKVARMVRDVKATLKRLNLKYADIEPLMPKAFTDKHIPERIETAEKLRALGFNNVVILYLTGVTSENKTSIRRFLPLQYRPLIVSTETISFVISSTGILYFSAACLIAKIASPSNRAVLYSSQGSFLPFTL